MQSLPEINLDAFNFCVYKRWRFAEVFAVNIAIAFGTPSLSNIQRDGSDAFHPLPHCNIVDLFAFLIILITAKRHGRDRHPGISSILDAILREATLYFLFIFASHFLFELFLFFAPVGDV